MRTYARIANGVVAELLALDGPIAGRFHASLVWQDVTGKRVETGWLAAEGTFVAPPEPAPTVTPPTLESVQAQLAALAAQVATLRAKR